MNTNVLATAAALSGQDLLTRLSTLAGQERETMAELLAHLAGLDDRPDVYAGHGYGSLYAYCTQALRFSEDAACNRIEAARACRRFPVILERLASGEMSLTSVRLLGRHLTPENHETVLERAKGRTREELEMLVAALAPRPDARSLVRKLPTVKAGASPDVELSASVPPEGAVTVPLSPAAPVAWPRPSIRPETDGFDIRTPPPPARYVPRAVRRAVWRRDGSRCAFVSATGHRCTERSFLEFHHLWPYARKGAATVDNISLRCRRHNRYEAEVVLGPRGTSAHGVASRRLEGRVAARSESS